MRPDDHRAIARRMDLFHLQEEGPGMVFWHPNGFAILRVIEDYIRRRMAEAGFRYSCIGRPSGPLVGRPLTSHGKAKA